MKNFLRVTVVLIALAMTASIGSSALDNTPTGPVPNPTCGPGGCR